MTNLKPIDPPDRKEKGELATRRCVWAAELIIRVMITYGGTRTWQEWARLAYGHYLKHRQAFFDDDVEGLLTSKLGDRWVKVTYLHSVAVRIETRNYATEQGYLVGDNKSLPRGIFLANESGVIERCVKATHSMIGRITDVESQRANNLNQKGFSVPLIVAQSYLPSGD